MTITANTKIAALIKANPAAIDAIASINPHFKKLQNPVLRKIFASRVTIADAAKIGKCDIEIFFQKLKPLGFTVDIEGEENMPDNPSTQNTLGNPIGSLSYDILLDVREDISNEKDPFKKIMQAATALQQGNVMLLINSFEPLPLICILKDRGFSADVIEIAPDEVHTYFRKTKPEYDGITENVADEALFSEIANRFNGKLKYVDVRKLPMPQPMITILNSLNDIPQDTALFVYHKKIPLFLLPELKERQYLTVARHTAEGVELIIYKHP